MTIETTKTIKIAKAEKAEKAGRALKEVLTESAGSTDSADPNAELTPREYEVLALLAMGYSNYQIGLALWITGSTVEQHLHHIFRKLRVTTRVQAARYAWDHEITLEKLAKK